MGKLGETTQCKWIVHQKMTVQTKIFLSSFTQTYDILNPYDLLFFPHIIKVNGNQNFSVNQHSSKYRLFCSTEEHHACLEVNDDGIFIRLYLYGTISPLSFTSSSTNLKEGKHICKTYSKVCSSAAKGCSI